jgi:hypothetical protein
VTNCAGGNRQTNNNIRKSQMQVTLSSSYYLPFFSSAPLAFKRACSGWQFNAYVLRSFLIGRRNGMGGPFDDTTKYKCIEGSDSKVFFEPERLNEDVSFGNDADCSVLFEGVPR